MVLLLATESPYAGVKLAAWYLTPASRELVFLLPLPKFSMPEARG